MFCPFLFCRISVPSWCQQCLAILLLLAIMIIIQLTSLWRLTITTPTNHVVRQPVTQEGLDMVCFNNSNRASDKENCQLIETKQVCDL